MKVFGHRGAAGHAPENTRRSIRKALDLDVDGVEFDVRLTRDGVPVVIHDATLERTMGTHGIVAELTSVELRQLLPDQDTTVPTLLEALDEIGKSTRINVELKEREAVHPTLRLLAQCAEADIVDAELILVTSFDWRAMEEFRTLTDNFAVGLLTKEIPDDSYWQTADAIKARSANISLNAVNTNFVERAHRAGMEVMVFTVNETSDVRRMVDLGVDTIFTDFPDRAREGLS